MNKKNQLLLKNFNIDLQRLTATFGSGAINRGINYFKNGYVLSTKVLTILRPNISNNNITVIVARVEGSGSHEYKTECHIQITDTFKKITSQCSCPVQANCKHGIATLFSYLNDLTFETSNEAPDEKNEIINPQIENWLDLFSADPISKSKPSMNDCNYHLIYLLGVEETPTQNTFFMQVMKARFLKKGGYGKLTNIDGYELEESTYGNNPIYFTSEDIEIITGLMGLSEIHDYYETKYVLEGEVADLLLNKILNTERLFWHQNKEKPLLTASERLLDFNWIKKGQNFIPKITSKPIFHYAFLMKNAYYLDLINHQIGLLSYPDMSSRQMMMLMQAPPIPKKQAKLISQRLFKTLPEIDIPLPEKINIQTKEIKEVQPTIKLCLKSKITYSEPIHYASLSFDYAGLDYQPKNELELYKDCVIFIKDNSRYKLFHQQALEQQAIQRLKSFKLSQGSNIYPELQFCDFLLMQNQPLAEQVLAWDHFKMKHVPALEVEGWEVSIDDSFNLKIDYIEDWVAEIEESEGGDWFEMALGFELAGKKVNLLPLLIDLLIENPDTAKLHQTLKKKKHQLFQINDKQWVKVSTKRILTVLDTIIELYDTQPLNKEGNFEFSKHAALNYGDLLNDPQLKWKGAKELQKLTEKIKNFSGIENIPLPQNLKATLRDYQHEGYNWLKFLNEYQFNGILADDMGLGKTVQALSLLLSEKEAGKAKQPNLIIAPTSLMSNWKQEVEKFTPDLSVLILQGANRKKQFDQIENFDLVLTTYPLMSRDQAIYEKKAFHYIILDEAQMIKNAKSKTSQLIYKIKANHRLCITGTPIENHLGELWSMFHFAMPGYLDTHERFNRLFRKPIEKEGDAMRGVQLRKRVTPFMLRRTKDLVAKELPSKTEIIRTVSLSGKQRDLYETVRLAMDKRVRDEIKKKGLARSHIMILDALLKLRQVCCDPQLVKLVKAKKVQESAKLDLLMSMIPEMVDEGRKILLFSQFTSMLSIIEKALKQHKIEYSKLTGQTRKRAEAIQKFQEGDAKVFLISLKAGGVGLNLTAADVVIHYDPWWNPAVERQATDRAYRIGQDKPVFVYKLITEETVEEKILEMQAKKQALADSVYDGNENKEQARFGQNELMALLAPLK